LIKGAQHEKPGLKVVKGLSLGLGKIKEGNTVNLRGRKRREKRDQQQKKKRGKKRFFKKVCQSGPRSSSEGESGGYL